MLGGAYRAIIMYLAGSVTTTCPLEEDTLLNGGTSEVTTGAQAGRGAGAAGEKGAKLEAGSEAGPEAGAVAGPVAEAEA